MKEETGNCIKVHNFTHTTDEVDDICICDSSVAIGPKGIGSEYYHNMVSVSGGSHSSAVNTVFYTFFQNISRDYGVKIKDSDYSGKFSIIISTLANKLSPERSDKRFY